MKAILHVDIAIRDALRRAAYAALFALVIVATDELHTNKTFCAKITKTAIAIRLNYQ